MTPGRLWGFRSDGSQADKDSNPGCTYNKKSDTSATRIKYVKQADLYKDGLYDTSGEKHWLAHRLYNRQGPNWGISAGGVGAAWVFVKSISEELPACQYCGADSVANSYPYLDNGRYMDCTGGKPCPGGGQYAIVEYPESGRVSDEKLVQLDSDGRNSQFPDATATWTSHASTGYEVSITVDIV